MGWLIGILQLLGIILLFTPLWIMGIGLIVLTGFAFFLVDRADNQALDKALDESRFLRNSKKQTFDKTFREKPFSSKTENAYNDLSYMDRPAMGNYEISSENLKNNYKDRLSLELDRFEKAYIDRGEQTFREFKLLGKFIYDQPNIYDQICDYLGKPKIPELSEDLAYCLEDQRSLQSFHENAEEQRANFLIHRIKQLEKDGKERRVIQSKVALEFEKTFGDEISLKRINGKWFAEGSSLGGRIEL
jgi:hypothetical protein